MQKNLENASVITTIQSASYLVHAHPVIFLIQFF